jgi:hypothetical protein
MHFMRIKKFTFALILALGFAFASGLSSLPTVQAEPQRHQERGQHQMQPQQVIIMERMQRSAFREGYRSGRIDARRGFRPNVWRHQGYRLGNRMQRRDFRVGYQRGFRRV